jgi:hypothetical protein
MTSPPHDLNGEEPARNDYRGDRAERQLTVRGYAARGGFGASSIRQPRAGRPEHHDLCAAAAEVGTGVIGSYPAIRSHVGLKPITLCHCLQ